MDRTVPKIPGKRLIESNTTLREGRGNPTQVSKINNPRRGLPSRGCCKSLMYVLLISWLLRGVGRWTSKPVNHTSWVAVVTPTDRPKSVSNRCLIELFCGVVFVLSRCPFDISVGVGAFVIGLGQISSFWSLGFPSPSLNVVFDYFSHSCLKCAKYV